jgi:tripartite ATP-independent transporter DctM subunit
LILPSVPLILYGIVAQQVNVGESFTVRELFLAGLVPALLMIVALSIWASIKHRSVPVTKFNASQVWKAVVAAKWEIPLPIVILGGIYSGLFAISEAAAITALYALCVEVFLYKELKIKRLPSVIRESMIMVGSIILILGAALALTNYFVDAQIPQKLFEFINVQISNPIVFLILLNLVLLALGAVLDIFSAIVIMVPLLLPVAVGYGIHPVHLGIIFMANMQIGYFTPPIGMNLFIACYRFEKPVVDLYRATLPFMGVLLIVLVLITYIPQLSLWYQYF